jgi:nitroreductase
LQEQKIMPQSIEEVNQAKKAPEVEGVLHIFHTRWSPRSFTDRAVSPDDLAKVFEAARWAASSYNEQPWRYLVGLRGSDTYKKIFDSLMPPNQQWATPVPVLILGAAKMKFTNNGSPNRVALYDLGAASSYLTLQASALGLAAHQMGGFDGNAARKAFAVPDEYDFGAVIALGYQGEPDALTNDKLRSQEVAPRGRKEFNEFVFSAWDTPAEIG